MGLFASQPDHARRRPDAYRRPDRRKAPPRLCAGRIAGGLSLFAALLWGALASADTLRIATWHGDFSRKGPGLMLHDLLKKPPDLSPIKALSPDILLLTDIDYDAGLVTLRTLSDQIGPYPYLLSQRPNRGLPTGRDIDGDGRLGEPEDAQGFGNFSGQGGMALLSRYPLTLLEDHSPLLWKDAPDSQIARTDPAYDVQRLSSSGHWAVQVDSPLGQITLLTLTATPPVFDGPEDRNGRRNRDEVLFWHHHLPQHPEPVILLGNFNLDPKRSDGLRAAASKVLSAPRLQDPLPDQPTVTWDGTGPMRVSYVLPDSRFQVTQAGVQPALPDLGPHGLVWVTITGAQ
ncbi:MAG: endonuclease/exonuclease/phosphatase family protein [Pelagimonas sp.]|nr:endonuclease/exonuclease/phosphatase family protein [Pelagimonas sp.]